MSTEITFQVGDTIRVLPTGGDLHNGLHPNAEVTVEHADETHVVVSGSHLEWFARRFELVKRADATPAPLDPYAALCDETSKRAPLDPSKVKAGDTVTLVGSHGTELAGPVEKVVRHTNGSLGFWVNQMTFYLGEFWTLTAHQPAPEPESADEATSLAYWLAQQLGEHVDDQDGETLTETVQRYVSREWMPKTGTNPATAPEAEPTFEPGAVYSARYLYMSSEPEQVWYHDTGASQTFTNSAGDLFDETELLDVRPLVVIDPATVDADALAAAVHKTWGTAGQPGQMAQLAAVAAIAHLGIEATR